MDHSIGLICLDGIEFLEIQGKICHNKGLFKEVKDEEYKEEM